MPPPPISNTSAEPTLYDILALSPKHLEGQTGAAQQQKIVKQAYRRALLKYHPDKAGPAASSSTTPPPSSSTPPPPPNSTSKPENSQKKPPSPSSSSSSSSSKPQPRIQYTVDQIQHAYSILSNPQQRRAYTQTLHSPSPSSRPPFQPTGLETVDLDDVAYDPRNGGVYHRPCRCGNPRGYAFTEDNLAQFEDDGVLMVECLDCSLWVRVLFAAADDDEEDEDEDEDDEYQQHSNSNNTTTATFTATATASTSPRGINNPPDTLGPRNNNNNNIDIITAGERRGSGARRGFTFNWTVNWGISLTGSATVGSGSGTSPSSSSVAATRR
ncbi:uncharacterized protein GGS25DRAFT_51930 [Hypoxylon fragiforme]|uniref:uncharacterized protein n=1 Tax=Hypoxylon fragiforme TaxID=63214 RepID=UPI0020C6739E|nr:uncharacterized protein GGS25DRAFT_51930 [Hypoxylon fragiforme]KAI2614465.1 hypothetical protein GGS25DRAFT_51930 [Hypoxylon fragiforme]